MAHENLFYTLLLCFHHREKIYEEPRVKLFKNVTKSILSKIRFYLEDDDYKPVDFNGETISFTCQLI